mmetsp:Transcript_13533/g.51619  ORF Transcript_13533/g.51619 Transcript_13533/m.51619 type:complete len:202 (+) Transcript_13533:1242-1847(+)
MSTAAAIGAAREAPVRHFEDAVGPNQEVLRLDVPVHESPCVTEREGCQQLVQEGEGLAARQPAVVGRRRVDHLPQIGLGVLKYKAHGTRLEEDHVPQLDNIWVSKLPQRLELPNGANADHAPVRLRGLKLLDAHRVARLRARPVHPPVRALSQHLAHGDSRHCCAPARRGARPPAQRCDGGPALPRCSHDRKLEQNSHRPG